MASYISIVRIFVFFTPPRNQQQSKLCGQEVVLRYQRQSLVLKSWNEKSRYLPFKIFVCVLDLSFNYLIVIDVFWENVWCFNYFVCALRNIFSVLLYSGNFSLFLSDNSKIYMDGWILLWRMTDECSVDSTVLMNNPKWIV